jgi:hypothetical protein
MIPSEMVTNSDGCQLRWLPTQMVTNSDGYQLRWLPTQMVTNSDGYQLRWLPTQMVTNSDGYQLRWLPTRLTSTNRWMPDASHLLEVKVSTRTGSVKSCKSMCLFHIFIYLSSMQKQEENQRKKNLMINSKQKSYLVLFCTLMWNCSCKFSRVCISFTITRSKIMPHC